jgi:hypothetical protein
MATKDKLMRLLQEVRGLAEIRRPHPSPKPSPLFLMQLRSHMSEASRPKGRLLITVNHKEVVNFPHPVQIKHLKTDSGV